VTIGRAALTLALLPVVAPAWDDEAAPPPAQVAQTEPALRNEDLLLFEVTLDRGSLTDSLQAYATERSVLVPVGELSRLLDLAIDVDPRQRRIVGRIGEAQRPLLVDLATGTARIDGRPVPLEPWQAAASLTDIYVDTGLVEKLLPLRVNVDTEGLVLALTATEELPIQARVGRLARLRALQPDAESREDVLRVDSGPGLWSLPAFDVAIESAIDHQAPRFRRRFDVRAGADAFYSNLQAYLGSDERGKPSTARFLFERRDLDGDMLGPLSVRRLSAGDVFTPALPMGPRGIGGRGVTLSTASLEQTSVFDRVDLRGELPIGFDVELYINDVLRSGQQTPVQGRYEFLDVPLVRGVNVIRVVSYGPRGERFEETRVINVGGGALAKGQTTVDVGVVQQERSLLTLDSGIETGATTGAGKLRATASIAHGLTESLTVIAGASVFTPATGAERRLAAIGARTSLLGYAIQADAAYDDAGGKAIAIGAAGSLLGASAVVRHAEYRDGFVDEALPAGFGQALRRHSEGSLDFNVGPVLGVRLPLSVRALRDEFGDGRSTFVGGVRLSTSVRNVQLSAGFDYDRLTIPGQPDTESLAGVLAASTYAGYEWQLRGTLDYALLPTSAVRGVAVTADRNLSDRVALRFGAGRSFSGLDDSTFQAGAILRLPFADVALSGDYTMPKDHWRVGLQVAFGLLFDPVRRSYVLSRPGPAIGGNAAVRAFVDRDGDERFDPTVDEPAPNVKIRAGTEEATTDAGGRALVTGLGYGPSARLQMNIDDIDNPYVSTPPSVIEFTPRAGGVETLMYPLKPVGEVLARVQYRDPAGRLVGLSAVRVRAVRDGREPVEAATEFDGTVVFERLEIGRYRLELDPAQAAKLGMRLVSPIEFEIPPDGGFVPDIVATLLFDEAAKGASTP